MESYKDTNSFACINEDPNVMEHTSNITISVGDVDMRIYDEPAEVFSSSAQVSDEWDNLYLHPLTPPHPSIDTTPYVEDFMHCSEYADTVRYEPQTSLHTPIYVDHQPSYDMFDCHNIEDTVPSPSDDTVTVVYSSIQKGSHASPNVTTHNILVKDDVSTPPCNEGSLTNKSTVNVLSHQYTPDRLQTLDQNSDRIAPSSIQPLSNNIVSQKVVNNINTPQMLTQNIESKQNNHKKRKNERTGKPCASVMKSLKQVTQTSADSDMIMSVPSTSTSGTKKIKATRKLAPSTSKSATRKTKKSSKKPEDIPPTLEYINNKLFAHTNKHSVIDLITKKTTSVCKALLTDIDTSIDFVSIKLEIKKSETNSEVARVFSHGNKTSFNQALKNFLSSFVKMFLNFGNAGTSNYYCAEYKTLFTILVNVRNTAKLDEDVTEEIAKRLFDTTFVDEIMISFNSNN